MQILPAAVFVAVLATGALAAADCSKTSTGLKPLTAPFFTNYNSFPGGLYPNGSNERPSAHELGGRTQAASVRPRDGAGSPNDQTGRIVLLTMGFSNTTQNSPFQMLAASDPQENPRIQIVNGSQDGWSADRIVADPNTFWSGVDKSITAAGVTGAQVQTAWVKLADANPTLPFPNNATQLQAEIQSIIGMARSRYPNLRLVYLSSRIYAGYAATNVSSEPYAYESGFAVKWLIEAQMKGDATLDYSSGKFPWLAWGPYLWADGTMLRADGLVWNCTDFEDDGTRPSVSGQNKAARMLLDFFKSDTTARPWFAVVPAGTPKIPAPTAVLNAAGFFATIAPGGIASIFGTNLASDAAAAAALPLPYGIGGTTVDAGGQPAPIYFVSPTQINFVVPAGANNNNITITREGSTSAVITAQLALNTEGLFTVGSISSATAVHADGGLINTDNPAHRGETIELYGTGLGIRNPAILSPIALPIVTVGGSAAQIQYYGPQPNYPGLDQLNITIPADAPTGPAVAVIVQAGSFSSNAATLAIQ